MDHQLHIPHPILDTQYPDLVIHPSSSHFTLRHHPLSLSAHSVHAEEPALDQLPRLPGGEAPADTMEGRALQACVACKATRPARARHVRVLFTVTPSRSSFLPLYPVSSRLFNIRVGRLMQASPAETPAHIGDVATAQVPSSRARCQRSGAAPTLRDLARRPIRLLASRSRLTVVQPQLLHTWTVSTRRDYC